MRKIVPRSGGGTAISRAALSPLDTRAGEVSVTYNRVEALPA
jgi:hypothetical protein